MKDYIEKLHFNQNGKKYVAFLDYDYFSDSPCKEDDELHIVLLHDLRNYNDFGNTNVNEILEKYFTEEEREEEISEVEILKRIRKDNYAIPFCVYEHSRVWLDLPRSSYADRFDGICYIDKYNTDSGVKYLTGYIRGEMTQYLNGEIYYVSIYECLDEDKSYKPNEIMIVDDEIVLEDVIDICYGLYESDLEKLIREELGWGNIEIIQEKKS